MTNAEHKSNEELRNELSELQQKYNSLKASYDNDKAHFKQTEEQLKKTQLLLQSSVESGKDMLVISIDKNYQYLYFNSSFKKVMLKLYGKNIEIGMNHLSCVTSNKDRASIKENFDRALAGESHVTLYEHSETERYYFETIFNPILNDNHEVIGATAFSGNVTERKQAEEALKFKTALLEAQVNASLDGILIINENNKRLLVNQRFIDLLNVSPQILSDDDDTSLFQFVLGLTKYPEKFLEKVMYLNNHKKETSIDEIEFKSGMVLERYSYSILDKEGKNYGRIWTFHDITERKKAENELIKAKETAEENEAKFKVAFLTSPDSVNINTMDGEYIEINEGFTELTGYTRKDVIGIKSINLGIWAIPEDRELLVNTLKEKGIIENLETFFRCKDGRLKSALMSASLIQIKNIPYILSITKDITSRTKLENELVKAKDRAEESDRLKTAFLQNMSHEIRTPMNAITGFARLIVKNYNNKPKLERFAEVINQRCNDLLEIISDILDIAKIESGQLPVHEEECNLNTLFGELTVFFLEQKKHTDKQHIKFRMHAMFDSSNFVIVTDQVKLKQIFINLISNAFKFTDSGNIEGGCKFDDNGNLIFYVSDTGIGISPDKHERIFERFTQLEKGSNRLYGGTGLGLPIVKGLIGLLNGKIWLESESGKGSTFYFTFPCQTIGQLSENHLAADASGEFQFPGKTILIVEDDKYNMEYFKEILVDTGLNILCAENGREAIRIALSQSPDLILMDIRLPDTDGYKAAREMRLHKPNLKIIAQTGNAMEEDKQKAFDEGFADYLSKPIDYDMLRSMLNKHLR